MKESFTLTFDWRIVASFAAYFVFLYCLTFLGVDIVYIVTLFFISCAVWTFLKFDKNMFKHFYQRGFSKRRMLFGLIGFVFAIGLFVSERWRQPDFGTFMSWYFAIFAVLICTYGIVEFFWGETKRKLILDEEGIRAQTFTVNWSEVSECKYGRDLARKVFDRTLVVTTNDNKEYSEFVAFYRFDKNELIDRINKLAGREVFDVRKFVESEKRSNISRLFWVFVLVMMIVSAFMFFRCGVGFYYDGVRGPNVILFWWIAFAVSLAAIFGHYYWHNIRNVKKQ